MAAEERFEIEYDLPFNAFTPGPLGLALGAPLLGVVATGSYWVGLVLFALGCAAAWQLFGHPVGRTIITVTESTLVLDEQPGNRREFQLDDIQRIMPKERESVYKDENDTGMLVIQLRDGNHVRLPENRALVIPYRAAERTARNLLDQIGPGPQSARSAARKASP